VGFLRPRQAELLMIAALILIGYVVAAIVTLER
jgi:hypothetical protein